MSFIYLQAMKQFDSLAIIAIDIGMKSEIKSSL